MTSVNFVTKLKSFQIVEEFKSIPKLIKELSTKLSDLEDGKLDVSDLENLSDHARELYERLVVLKHKAYDDEVRKSEPLPFKIGKSKSSTPPQNQTSLIDAIEEIGESDSDNVEGKTLELFQEELTDEQPSIEEEIVEEVLQDDSNISDDEPKEVIEIEDNPVNDVEEPLDLKEENEEEEIQPVEIQEQIVEEQEDEVDLQSESIIDKHVKAAISNLKSEINLNQKFQFINFLFDGDNKLYESTLNKLNEQQQLTEALDIFENSKIVDEEKEDSEEVELMFTELIERRYS